MAWPRRPRADGAGGRERTDKVGAGPADRSGSDVASGSRVRGLTGPVVVGGLGGSGTRVVAEMLREAGIYTGGDLNESGDNLWFTLMFKLPRWEGRRRDRGRAVPRALGVLERAMTGGIPNEDDRRFIDEAVARSADCWRKRRLRDDRPPGWLEQRRDSLLRSGELFPGPHVSRWGWKAPTSHIYLPEMAEHFGEDLQYVHVIRNGLYMAHSKNQSQVHRWGDAMGISERSSGSKRTASLDFWIEANSRAMDLGGRLGTGRFLLLHYDDLCADPVPAVRQLVDFLRIEPPAPVLTRMEGIPRPPTTMPDRSWIPPGVSAEQLARVEALGFPVGER